MSTHIKLTRQQSILMLDAVILDHVHGPSPLLDLGEVDVWRLALEEDGSRVELRIPVDVEVLEDEDGIKQILKLRASSCPCVFR